MVVVVVWFCQITSSWRHIRSACFHSLQLFLTNHKQLYCDLHVIIIFHSYHFLTKLLGKTLSLDKNFSYEIIQLIAGPLLSAAQLIEDQPSQCKNYENLLNLANFRPSITCLTEILERLLQEYNSDALTCVINLKVGCFGQPFHEFWFWFPQVDLASDTLSKVIRDHSTCLILDRISLILSFFKLSDVFDGIKSISQDPLALTGFLRIVETEVDKGGFTPQINNRLQIDCVIKQ